MRNRGEEKGGELRNSLSGKYDPRTDQRATDCYGLASSRRCVRTGAWYVGIHTRGGHYHPRSAV